jgi:hypothetical protein
MRKMISPGIVILIGAIISALGAWWAYHKQDRDRLQFERDLRQKSDEIASLYQTLAKSQRELREKADSQVQIQQELVKKSDEVAQLNREIAQAQRDLRFKSDEIAELNRTIAASVTGGDSFCYIDMSSYGANEALLMLVHQGRFPLYDISIRIVDLQKFDLIKNIPTLEALSSAQVTLRAGNLAPNQSSLLTKLPLPNTDLQAFNIFISARNGFVDQLLRARRLHGRWIFASKVMRGYKNDEVLLEKIDEGFPRNKQGQVDWQAC